MATLDRFQGTPRAVQPRATALEGGRYQTPFKSSAIPPIISAFTPASGSTILRTASIAVSITDVLGTLRYVTIYGVTADGKAFTVWDESAFTGDFDAGSSVVSITGGYTFTVVHDAPGWPTASVALHVVAVNTNGDKAESTGSFTISNPLAAPTIGTFVPAAASTILAADSLAFAVADDVLLTTVVVTVTHSTGLAEVVHDGAAFKAPYSTSSTRTGSAAAGYAYTLVRTGGWPAATLTLRIDAFDGHGNETTSSPSFTVSNPTNAAAPVIGSFVPSAASTIARTGTVQFDVTDDSGSLSAVIVYGVLADGTVLVVHDGSAFTAAFDAASTRTGITNGYRYVVQADGLGWASSSVTLRVRAVDPHGNTTLGSAAYTISSPPAAPVISAFSPAAGAIARTSAVTFTATDSDGFAKVLVWAVLADGSTVVVYTGSAFGPEVDAASTVSGTTTKSFSVVYDGAGWPDDYTLHVLAIDAGGASTSASSAYTLSNPPAGPDIVVPTVGNFSPATGATLARADAVEFDVTDAGGLRKVLVLVRYATGAYEVAHDGTDFAASFTSKSSRTNITGGSHYRLVRTGGWPAAPTIRVVAIDGAGNEP